MQTTGSEAEAVVEPTASGEETEYAPSWTSQPCSSSRVLVVASHTSVGPQYWIGPGYT